MLTAPLPWNRKRKTVETAIELVTEGKKNAVRRAPRPRSIRWLTMSARVSARMPAGSRVEARAALAELRGVGRLGEVAFEGAQASVKLDETAGARLTVQAGDITVGRLGGAAEISTLKGDLTVTEAVRGAVALDTRHGDITVGAARGVSAALDAGTGHGRIDNGLKNADGADAALRITATTSYGDITARTL
ncbi:hypothetical protein ABZX77_44845 [Streptomyces sp. NPDC004237]|uniref:hypothetical protein n=1 Tax=Streptomyces sp. NPDC004237 TaxID=3154455 RepID=UPI0033BC8BF4